MTPCCVNRSGRRAGPARCPSPSPRGPWLSAAAPVPPRAVCRARWWRARGAALTCPCLCPEWGAGEEEAVQSVQHNTITQSSIVPCPGHSDNYNSPNILLPASHLSIYFWRLSLQRAFILAMSQCPMFLILSPMRWNVLITSSRP